MSKKTKKAYIEYLDSVQPEQGSEQWIIGGKIPMFYMWSKQYGKAMQKHDPIGFEVGYNEWKNN